MQAGADPFLGEGVSSCLHFLPVYAKATRLARYENICTQIGSIKALSRLYQGSIKDLFKAVLRFSFKHLARYDDICT
jgi:hypothetical protein